MEILKYLIFLFEIIIFGYLALNICYFFLFAFASLFKQRKKLIQFQNERKIAILIPGYREDTVIIETVSAAYMQDYPSDKFDVIVIADTFKDETIASLKEFPITVFPINLGEGRTKAQALNYTMEKLQYGYDIALVLDADNIIEPKFLSKINNAFNRGFHVVQGHRVAKNMNNSMAVLDAISEEINNKIYRKGHCNLGLPSGLIGSGMAFEYKLFYSVMKEIHAVGGFDKELELRLAQQKWPIAYVEDALVYDEKVHKSTEFKNQRRRWLAAQFVYLRRFFKPAIVDLFKSGNIFFFDKLLQMALLPRILLLGVVTMLFIFRILAYFLLNGQEFDLLFGVEAWTYLFTGVIFIFLFAIPPKFYKLKTLVALMSLPKTFLIMFLLLFKLKGANRRFIHTSHGVNE
jgi:cellulose synthase/poly-beta-1,6-N-acetylglucosamine synthase-like glycosyltransferase